MEDHEMCSNCRRDIPMHNYKMHSLHCARNIALCPACDEPIPRGELEDHKQAVHADIPCPDCGNKVEACKLPEHQAELCPKRKTYCKFCEIDQAACELSDHENYCGSRTEKCTDCGEWIMLKNWEIHISSNHGFIKLKDEPGPKPSWEAKPSTSKTSLPNIFTNSNGITKVSDPAPSTPTQRANFTATELFNNQDLYSSKRYSTTTTKHSTSALHKSSSSSVVVSGSQEPQQGVTTSASSSQVKATDFLSKNDDEQVMLPCEFCESMIPMYKLLEHQAECVNPTNVRGPGIRSSGSAYRPYSAASTSSVSRSSSLHGSSSSGMVNKYLRQSSTSTPTSTPPSTLSRYSSTSNNNATTPNRKVSPIATNGSMNGKAESTKPDSIVSRYVTGVKSPEPTVMSPEPIVKSPSPPSRDRSETNTFSRPSYLTNLPRSSESTTTRQPRRQQDNTPGMYNNEDDREGLRQMLSSLRRDPMDVEDDPDNNDGSFFPCEFCGDPYPSEFLMRHQMSCDLNPQPVSSGSGFDYNQIQSNVARNLGISVSARETARSGPAAGDQDHHQQQQQSSSHRALSRNNSVTERSYSRTRRASSVSRTSSFADRSYGTLSGLARQASFSIADYSSAVRRSSVFDGYSGYAIYSSISEGLDQITYGGRTSRRNSITADSAFSSFSRRGSMTGGDYPLPALMAALEASKAAQEERRENNTAAAANAHVNGQASAYLNGYSSSHTSYSRQTSQVDAIEANQPFGSTNGHMEQPRSNGIERSESKVMRRRSSLKHSQSGHKLERKVSFHKRDVVINGDGMAVDENGQPLPDKPRRKKERTEEEKAARAEKKAQKKREKSRERKSREEVKVRQHQPTGGDLFDQVSSKLRDIERERSADTSQPSLAPVPSSSLFPNIDGQGPPQTKASSVVNNSASTDPHPESQAPSSDPSTSVQVTTNANHLNGHVDVQNTDNKLTINGDVCKPRSPKGPAPLPPSEPQQPQQQQQESTSAAQSVNVTVKLRDQPQVPASPSLNENDGRSSKTSSKRNSLDNKSVQSLAKDLAAECAKAYELMESSLSKLTTDFAIGPFGITPKAKRSSKKYQAPPAPALN